MYSCSIAEEDNGLFIINKNKWVFIRAGERQREEWGVREGRRRDRVNEGGK
jgi:hypothetical protein